MLRILLCDDEPLALQRLRDLLLRIPDVEVADAVSSGKEALEAVSRVQPDAVLLDIEMPSLDGFDVVEELARIGDSMPLIVFVTAFPQFAALAFETAAIDFLTKPVRLHRLEHAIGRMRKAIEERSAAFRLRELASQLDALRAERMPKPAEQNHVWVQRRGEAVRVVLDRVDWVHAEGEYVRIVIGEASYLHRESLTALLERLDPAGFVRIHRSVIVNRDQIASVRRRPTGSYQLLTERGQELPVGRSYRKLVRAMLTNKEGRNE
jgi:DNA-binding LytR/AlgR family response regulator